MYLVYNQTRGQSAKRMGSQSDLFAKIKQRTLAQEVTSLLRKGILAGDLPAGTHLNEREIADQMGVSRVPVREAIRRLSFEGLLVSTPNRGAYVRYFAAEDIAEIFDLRAVLEGLACQALVAGDKLTEADFAALQGLIDSRNASIAAEDYESWLEHELAFHDYLMARADSERLVRMWKQLQVQCVLATRDNWQSFWRNGGSHPIILEALRRGDPAEMIPLHQKLYEEVKQALISLVGFKHED